MNLPRLLVSLLVLSLPLVLFAEDPPMVALFDGKTIEGWTVRGGTATYRAEEGAVVGKTTEGSPNTFLCTNKEYGDFVLEFDVLCDPQLNSGCQIRSHVATEEVEVPLLEGKSRKIRPGVVYGYQCEIATHASKVSGNFYDEGRWGRWHDSLVGRPGAEEAFKDNEWNHYRIVAQGDHIRSWINGLSCADFHDSTDKSGFIGLQVHGIKKETGPFEVRWKNIRLRELKPDEKI